MQAEECHISGRLYTEKDTRVRDRCHITEKYRRSAHQDCNVNYFQFKFEDMKIPVIFHNPRSYDCHFVLQEIGERGNKYTLRTRKKKTNRWNSKEHGEIHGLYVEMPLVFLDSFQFMSLSLDWLASDLPHEAFKYTSEAFKDDKFKLMKKKGVYPYDFMGSFTKFDEKNSWKKGFYSILQDKHISDEQYKHAGSVEYIQSKYNAWISRSAFEVTYSSACWCLWKFQKDLFIIFQTWSMSLFHKSRIVIGYYF